MNCQKTVTLECLRQGAQRKTTPILNSSKRRIRTRSVESPGIDPHTPSPPPNPIPTWMRRIRRCIMLSSVSFCSDEVVSCRRPIRLIFARFWGFPFLLQKSRGRKMNIRRGGKERMNVEMETVNRILNVKM